MAGTFSMAGVTGSNFAVTRGMLTGYEVYHEGTRFLGMADVELPDFTFKTDTLTGPGIMGDLDMPGLGHTESLEITLNWRTINTDLIKLAAQKAHDVTLRGSQQNYDQSQKKIASEAVRIDFRGIPKQATLGKFEHVSQTESKSVFEVITLHVYVADVQKIKYDKVNYLCVIDGVDYLSEYRKNVGLSF